MELLNLQGTDTNDPKKGSVHTEMQLLGLAWLGWGCWVCLPKQGLFGFFEERINAQMWKFKFNLITRQSQIAVLKKITPKEVNHFQSGVLGK